MIRGSNEKAGPSGPAFFCGRSARERWRSRYDPRRPDFIDVAGGFPVLTGGAVGGCWTLVRSGTPWAGCCGPFFFFEKSGISFFLFISSPVGANDALCQRGDSNPHGLLHWILSPARLPIPPLRRSRPKIATASWRIKAFDRQPRTNEKPLPAAQGLFSSSESLALLADLQIDDSRCVCCVSQREDFQADILAVLQTP